MSELLKCPARLCAATVIAGLGVELAELLAALPPDEQAHFWAHAASECMGQAVAADPAVHDDVQLAHRQQLDLDELRN